MLRLIKDLLPYRSGIVCDGLDASISRICQELPFAVHEFQSGESINGWEIPPKWTCTKATIHNANGELIYDGNAHALGVCMMSNEFIAGIGGELLKQHLFYSEDQPDAIVYHCRWMIQHWARDWGFACSRRFYDSIDDRAAYHIELRTTFEPGTMKVAEYVLPGSQAQSILINAHICHASLANDDLSGVAVGVELFKRLAKIPNRRYTYRLVIGPEHMGTVHYHNRFPHNQIKYGIFIESVGSQGKLWLQQSFDQGSLVSRAIEGALPNGSEVRPYRTVVGNDESVHEAYGIPCPSLSRGRFPEYHCDLDNMSLMREESLEQAVHVIMRALEAMECNGYPEKRFHGLMCLSNPKYDLYMPMFDPSDPKLRTISDKALKQNALMDAIPQLFASKGPTLSILDVALRYGLPFREVHAYLSKWVDKGLMVITPHRPLWRL